MEVKTTSQEVINIEEMEEDNASSINLAKRRRSSRFKGKVMPSYAMKKKPKQNHSRKLPKFMQVTSMPNGSIAHINEHNGRGEVVVKAIMSDTCKEPMEEREEVLNHSSQQNNNKFGEAEHLEDQSYTDPSKGKSTHQRVKETLRLFNTHYLTSVQEEEKRVEAEKLGKKKTSNKKSTSKKVDDEKSNSTSNSKKMKNGTYSEGKLKRAAKRPDLKAVTKMRINNEILYPERQIGHLPGINVGDQFFSRCEMCAVGLHGHWLNGIDYIGKSCANMDRYKNYTLPLATCIVISGQYEDDKDDADVVHYTGQGGHDLLGTKKQIADQKLDRGNMALKNNYETGAPVRVIRGHILKNSYTGKVYTYDGLYKVTKYDPTIGASSFIVYKFELRRIEGQPELTTKKVLFARAQAPRSISELKGLVCNDISGGQENIPIPATNEVDDQHPLTDFEYSKSIRVADNLKLPADVSGCNCRGQCNPKYCSCAKLNGGDFPYVRKDRGRLIEAKSVVYECGPRCGCNITCVNRTSQQGIKYHLEVFRTKKKGWAVRSWDPIPPGAPVCEYTGILSKTVDINSLSGNNYIFEIDCLQTMKGLDGREKRPGDTTLLENIDDKAEPEFCIDAERIGNVARFINHSCEPNLFVQCVLSSHNDLRMAKVMLFAADTISPQQELCYDYGYALDSVVGSDGNIIQLPCYCGASECRKRLH